MGRSTNEIAIRNHGVENRIARHNYGERIYHYTSVTACVGILSKKELWLGSTATMNDKSEIVYFIKKLQNAVLEDLDPDKHDYCKSFFEKIYSRLKNEYPYAICFSTLNDNAAQWERYADDAHGVCVAFNTYKLLSLFYFSNAFFFEIFYQGDIKQHDHYGILIDYFNTGKVKTFGSEEVEMDSLIACAYMHKHESFNTESEIRLSNLWNRQIDGAEFSFEMINGKIKKVLKISLDKLCSDENIDFEDLIDEIIIAPRSEQNEQELKEYLESLECHKLSNKITKSQCPLR